MHIISISAQKDLDDVDHDLFEVQNCAKAVYNPAPGAGSSALVVRSVAGPTLGNKVGLFHESSVRFISNLGGLLVGCIEGGKNRHSWLGFSRIGRNRCAFRPLAPVRRPWSYIV